MPESGKSEMKLERMSILRHLTFKCVILEHFESLKNVKELCAGIPAAAFHIISVNVTVKSIP